MLSQNIRQGFLKYFKGQGHTIVPSSSVVPHDDPTILFANAGMNQFKDLFLGKEKREYSRATTTQKCIRAGGKHNDLENVGHTSRHLTFFEMLGNFSFGNYFKKEAIGYTWDVVCNVFAFDPGKIWVSIYKDDDEAFELWKKHVSEKRIVRFGEKENFWAMGDVGPCGPCSELLFDRGKEFSDAKSPIDDVTGERYLEFWNLVFMQFNKDTSGAMLPLPSKSIDTGAGLERVVALKMGVDSVFLTDILRSLIAEVENISKIKYNPHDKLAPSFNVISDHIRSLAFAIADGAVPSNVDRGYILRKILRRAARYGRYLNLTTPFLSKLLPRLSALMGDDFPELKKSEKRTAEILELEEESFIKTLQRGGNILSEIIEKAQKEKRKIKGEEAFKLKDTYGFPLEEILLIAKDHHLEVDLKTFSDLEIDAKERSKALQTHEMQKYSQNLFTDFVKTHAPSKFLGTETFENETKVIALLKNDKFVDELNENEEGIIILDATPFYPEMGGEVGDSGKICNKKGAFIVNDTKTPYLNVIIHIGKMKEGKIKKQDKVAASIDLERRKKIECNHSATHALHWALTQILGPHIKQKGSLVDENHLRFDFDHHKALSLEELRQVELLVNSKIRENQDTRAYELNYEEAQKRSDIKQFFAEKYTAKVRVVDMDFCKELCGGAHTRKLGNIGFFKIAKEMSISQGVRRIEAYTGKKAEEFVYCEEDLIFAASQMVKAAPAKLLERMETFMQEKKLLEQNLKNCKKDFLQTLSEELVKNKQKTKIGFLILEKLDHADVEEMKEVADNLIQKLQSGIVILATSGENICNFLVKVSADLHKKNVFANEIINEILPIIDGKGGGKKDFAQAGGKNPKQIPLVFEKIKEYLQKK